MRKVALLPNIITTGNIVCGLSAILYALSGNPDQFDRACWMIMLAILLDGLDGMIAVMTKSASKFGIHYDSMADMVSFGVAPAMLVLMDYKHTEVTATNLNPMYWAMTVVFVVCVAMRLARFNVQASTEEKSGFVGLPCPTPAAFVAMLLLSFRKYDYSLPPVLLFVIMIGLGILMVSNIPYPSPKKSNFFHQQSLSHLLIVVLFFALVVMQPVMILLLSATLYILFGIIMFFLPQSLLVYFEKLSSKLNNPIHIQSPGNRLSHTRTLRKRNFQQPKES